MPAAVPGEIVDLFLELARLDGRSGSERPVADRLLGFLRDLGLDPVESDRRTVGGGDAGNVVCTVRGGGDRVLVAHMDTARDTAGVRPTVADGRIVSDGSTVLGVDNRAGVAAILDALRRVDLTSGGPGFTVAFTVCEETTLAGSRHLRLPPGVEMGFVFDSALRPGNVIVRSPGARRFRARVEGRAAHAGIAPESGIDALQVVARAVAGMPLGRIDEITTANVGTLTAGTAINVVPDRALLEGEVRSFDPGRVDATLAVLRSRIEEAAREAGARVGFEDDWDFRPYVLREDAPVRVRAFRAAVAVGLEPVPAASAGGSDANSLNAAGIPSVNLGIGAENPHGNDEFIRIADLEAASNIAHDLMTRD